MREGMVLAIEPGMYWDGGGGLRLEDNYLITKRREREAVPLPRRLPVTEAMPPTANDEALA